MREAKAAAVLAADMRLVSPVRASRRGPVLAAVVTMRPKQWLKNALVIAAAGAAGALGSDDVPGRVLVAFFAFCLLASGIYAINDVRDRHEDRLHPRKRFRPVAAGELTPAAARVFGIVLMVTGLGLCAFISPLLALVGAHGAQRLEQARDRSALAQRRDPHGLERALVAGRRDVGPELAFKRGQIGHVQFGHGTIL